MTTITMITMITMITTIVTMITTTQHRRETTPPWCVNANARHDARKQRGSIPRFQCSFRRTFRLFLSAYVHVYMYINTIRGKCARQLAQADLI
jgi:hypothetical protein